MILVLTWSEYQQLYPHDEEIAIINKSGANFTSEKESYDSAWGVEGESNSNSYKKRDNLDKLPYYNSGSKNHGAINPIVKSLDNAGYPVYLVKGGITTIATWVLGPETAIKVGGLLWGTSRIVEGYIKRWNFKTSFKIYWRC